MLGDSVSVIIPAYNASATISRAVISALREREVKEVFVVDDASTDDTIKQAINAADGSKRLKIISLTKNSGPSVARNRALAKCTSTWIAIIDADDFILPDRFKAMFALANKADFIADDIWQVPDGRIGVFKKSLFGDTVAEPKEISFAEFVLSNVTRAKQERGELGFIKPMMRRSFLESKKLSYRNDLRLGEDYELYARALAAGARLYLIKDRGYVAVMRTESLSGKHSIEDLRRLRDCDESLGKLSGLSYKDIDALRQHYLSVDCRLQWRLLIDAVKKRQWKAGFATFRRPSPVPRYLMGQLISEFGLRISRLFGFAPKPRKLNEEPAAKPAVIFAALATFALIIASQKEALFNLWAAWKTEEYSHGIFVIALAGLLALHLVKNTRPVFKPSWFGLLCLLVGGALQFVAYFGAFDTAAEYGLVIEIIGLCLAFVGEKATRVMLPALLYLLFAVPLPHLIQANLSQKLQLISSSLGVMPLEWLRIPVFQEGNIIDLGGLKLQVVEACNGLRYLFPLMSFGYLVALLFEGAWWKRAFLFLSTIPIAIGLNALRISIIGITVEYWGQHMAEGFIHSFEGWSVFIVCLIFLLWETLILQHIGTPSRFRYEYLGLPKGLSSKGSVKRFAPIAFCLITTASLAYIFNTPHMKNIPEIHPIHPPFASFPLTLEAWNGRPEELQPDVLKSLQVSDYWLANYRTEGSPTVNLYVAYYASQRIGMTTHSPSNCIPGGGWQIARSEIKTITLTSGAKIEVTQLLIRRGFEEQIVYYWFQERGRDLTETTIAKWYLLIDSITMHRTDGALVRIGTPVAITENQAAAEARLNNFLSLSYPILLPFIPSAS